MNLTFEFRVTRQSEEWADITKLMDSNDDDGNDDNAFLSVAVKGGVSQDTYPPITPQPPQTTLQLAKTLGETPQMAGLLPRQVSTRTS